MWWNQRRRKEETWSATKNQVEIKTPGGENKTPGEKKHLAKIKETRKKNTWGKTWKIKTPGEKKHRRTKKTWEHRGMEKINTWRKKTTWRKTKKHLKKIKHLAKIKTPEGKKTREKNT
ncbi:hypothetical protein HYD71_03760 [Mycoplasmopsis bovis]|nr:hypothetical protein [Mycoplasmopsis bovis]QQH49615.1 hypothetical protein HYD71_03760 [Mycoplasmopsis bovis]